jgi:peptidyl-dipeptidase Dcp
MMSRRTVLQSTTALALAGATLDACAKPTIEPFLTRPWTGPMASPPFDKINTADIEPAFNAAFKEHLTEVDAIIAVKAAPTFDNTIAALEKSGRPLTRVGSVFGSVSGTMSDDAMQKVEQKVTPKMAAHGDEVDLRPGLYERVLAVHENKAGEALTPEQARVAERYEILMARAGAKLTPDQKKRATELNQQLAGLTTTFAHNLLGDEEGYALELSDADMAGLPDGLKADFIANAKDKKSSAKGLVANTRSAMEPFLTLSPRRDLREKGWRMWISRGDNNDARDNKKTINDILKARQEYAQLMGYKTFADYQLADTMAKTPQAALDLIAAVWKPAVAAVQRDVVQYQAMADSEGGHFQIQPWDYRYYAEKVRKAQFNVNDDEVKPYLQLTKLREATFWCANKLHGVTFEPRTDIAVYHPDMQVWTVKDASGKPIGLFYFDPFARAGKNSGAWMNEIRSEEKFDGQVLPLVVNCTNFSKPAAGQPALMSVDDVTTIFHEFGHGLHGLLTKTTYPQVAGTNVFRDFVEFPSQLNEHWAMLPQVLQKFAVHYKTGEPMPQSLIDRITAAAKFDQGFTMVELLACCWVDMDIHMADAANGIDAAEFEKASLAKLGMPPQIVMRHRLPQFAHIFGGNGYSAGYYSYLWSQVLDNDGFSAWEEAGDPFSPAVSKAYREEVLERGNSRDPAESYRAFRGRDPKIDALLKNRGFA